MPRLLSVLFVLSIFTFGAVAETPPAEAPADDAAQPVEEAPAPEKANDGPAADPKPDQRDDAKGPKLDPKMAPIDRAMRLIAYEGGKAFLETGRWPRNRPDFAADHPDLKVKRENLLNAMSIRLHRHPIMDGYIKWQLLSFLDDGWGELPLEQQQAMVQGLPVIPRHPEPNLKAINAAIRAHLAQARSQTNSNPGVNVHSPGTGSFSNAPAGQLGFGGFRIRFQHAFVTDFNPVTRGGFDPTLSVVNSGTLLVVNGTVSADRRYITITTELINSQLEELRDFNFYAVRSPLAFREEVIDNALPRQNGVRLFAMMKDVNDRILAHSPTTGEAVERLVEEAHASRRDPAIPAQARATLYKHLKELNRVQAETVRKVERGRGQTYVGDTDTLRLGTRNFTAVAAYLRGRDYNRD